MSRSRVMADDLLHLSGLAGHVERVFLDNAAAADALLEEVAATELRVFSGTTAVFLIFTAALLLNLVRNRFWCRDERCFPREDAHALREAGSDTHR